RPLKENFIPVAQRPVAAVRLPIPRVTERQPNPIPASQLINRRVHLTARNRTAPVLRPPDRRPPVRPIRRRDPIPLVGAQPDRRPVVRLRSVKAETHLGAVRHLPRLHVLVPQALWDKRTEPLNKPVSEEPLSLHRISLDQLRRLSRSEERRVGKGGRAR